LPGLKSPVDGLLLSRDHGGCAIQFFRILHLQGAQARDGRVFRFQNKRLSRFLKPSRLRLEFLPPPVQIISLPFQFRPFLLQRPDPVEPGQGPVHFLQPSIKDSFPGLIFLKDDSQSLFVILAQYPDSLETGLQRLQFLVFFHPAFVDLHGDQAVDPGSGDLFEDGRPLAGRGLEKDVESPLGKEHGAGKAPEIHARGVLDEGVGLVDLGFQNGPGFGVCDFVLRRLQLAVGPPPGAALAPVAAIAALPGLERHFREAFARLARHDLVAVLCHPFQPGCSAIEPQADGVHDGCFARARGACDGEDAVRRIIRMGEIDLPFPRQGIQVLEMNAEYPHAAFLFRHFVLFIQRDQDFPIGIQQRRLLVFRDLV
jgi:hypothetical protein